MKEKLSFGATVQKIILRYCQNDTIYRQIISLYVTITSPPSLIACEQIKSHKMVWHTRKSGYTPLINR
jgi:hypothetical protein